MIKFIHVFLICLIFSGFYTGCKSFDPQDYIIAGQPDECNDYYITIAVYYKNDQKDFSFPAILWNECKNARAKKLNLK